MWCVIPKTEKRQHSQASSGGTCISLTADVWAVTYRTQTDANAQYLHPLRAFKMQTHARPVSDERAGVRLIEHMLSIKQKESQIANTLDPMRHFSLVPHLSKDWHNTANPLKAHGQHKTCDTASHFVHKWSEWFSQFAWFHQLTYRSVAQ